MKKDIYKIIKFLFHNGLKIKELFFLTGLYSILLLAPTLFSLKMLDQIILDKNLNGFIYLAFITLTIFLISGVIDYYRSKIISSNLNNYFLMFIDKYYEELLNKKIDFENINKMKSISQNNLLEIIVDIPWLFFFLLAFFLLHPILGITSLLLIIIQFYYLFEKTNKDNETVVKKYKNIANLSSRFQQFNIIGMGSFLISLVKTTKEEINNEKEINDKYLFLLDQKVKMFKTVFQLVLITLGGILYINNQISLGAIIAISLLISKLISPLSLFYSNWVNILKMLDLINSSTHVQNIKKEKFNIFQDDKTIKIIFNTKQENIELNKGDILVITGMSGAGKTTMIENIIKSIDKVDYKIGYLSQNPTFISGSVEELISNFAEKQDGFLDSLKKSIALSGCDVLIQKFSSNIKTKLEKDKISMGELQKISLARAFFDNPNLIVLDEPENHLDYISLELIIKSINEMSKEGSTFIIASKNKNIKNIGNKHIMLNNKASE